MDNLLLFYRCGKYGRLTPAEFVSVRKERLNVMRIVVPPAVSTLCWSTIYKSFDMHYETKYIGSRSIFLPDSNLTFSLSYP